MNRIVLPSFGFPRNSVSIGHRRPPQTVGLPTVIQKGLRYDLGVADTAPADDPMPHILLHCGQQTRLLPVASNSAWVDYYRCDTCGTVLACEKNSSTVIHVSALLCSLCAGEGWICEEHPSKSWPHNDCQSLGAPCPMCQHLNDPPTLPADLRLLARPTTSHISCTCQGKRRVCEGHPLKPFPHDDCAGPGMPCPVCNTQEPPAVSHGK
jgi:hypothetical protein